MISPLRRGSSARGVVFIRFKDMFVFGASVRHNRSMNTRTLMASSLLASAFATSAHAFAFTTGGAITDNGTTVFEVDVAGGGAFFGDLTVSLDLSHTWAGDLTITLEHAGVSVTLLDRLGVPEDDFGNGADLAGQYDFTDQAFAETWDAYEVDGPNAGVTIPTGAYQVNNTDGTRLNDFRGIDIGGIWTLTISDAARLDTGHLNVWSMNATLTNPPAPGGAALFGVAAAAVSRRRR